MEIQMDQGTGVKKSILAKISPKQFPQLDPLSFDFYRGISKVSVVHNRRVPRRGSA